MNEYQRVILAQVCAAAIFKMFSDPKFRGSAWTPEKMTDLIRRYTNRQAFLANVLDKHIQQMEDDAVDFYIKFLEEPLVNQINNEKADQ